MRYILVLLICAASWGMSAQVNTTLADLQFYADVIANAGNPEHKQRAHDQFSAIMQEWITSDQFSEKDLDLIQWLSVKRPEDKAFTIVTWQLALDDNNNSYYGYLLHDNSVHKLVATTDDEDMEYSVLTASDWAGALYYNILEVTQATGKAYVLFGFDRHQNYMHRKIADVLTFENGEPEFGKEIFKRQEEGERGIIKNRLILDYSSDANVSLNYNPNLDMIVMDHLIARIGRIPGQGPTFLPDGSYVGWVWDGEYFNYIDKIYNQIQDSPPFPKPVLDQDSRNIMGQNDKDKKRRN